MYNDLISRQELNQFNHVVSNDKFMKLFLMISKNSLIICNIVNLYLTHMEYILINILGLIVIVGFQDHLLGMR